LFTFDIDFVCGYVSVLIQITIINETSKRVASE
jgi:hypothetical protein